MSTIQCSSFLSVARRFPGRSGELELIKGPVVGGLQRNWSFWIRVSLVSYFNDALKDVRSFPFPLPFNLSYFANCFLEHLPAELDLIM